MKNIVARLETTTTIKMDWKLEQKQQMEWKLHSNTNIKKMFKQKNQKME